MSQSSDLPSKESELPTQVKVVSTVSSLQNIESEVIPVKQSLDSTPTAEDLSYSTDDSFEIEPSEDRKKVIHVTATTGSSVQQAIPLLKGQYFRDDRFAYWTGKWGMSINGKINGDTSDFSYQIPCTTSESNSLEPISGIYQGYFWMKYKPPQKILDPKMHIVFTENNGKYIVSGAGSNRLGSYDLHGSYDPTTQELTCTKEYHTHPVKSKPHRTESTKETRNCARYLNYVVTGGIDIPSTVPLQMQACYRIHIKLINHKWAFPFLQPVDPVALHIPDYFSIIKQPMDLGTIKTKLINGEITTEEEYISLVRLVFDNAILYNKPQDDVAIMANSLSAFFERELKQVQQIENVFDLDTMMVTRRRSTKRQGDNIAIGNLQKKYSLRGSGFIDVGQKKMNLDLPGDVEPYQYHALEVFMKRLQGSIKKNPEQSK